MDVLKNTVEYGIIGLLIALSVWSVAVAIERWLYYRRIELSQFTDIQTFEMALTKRLVDASEILGIRLLDHVIVGGRSRHFSFRESGSGLLWQSGSPEL